MFLHQMYSLEYCINIGIIAKISFKNDIVKFRNHSENFVGPRSNSL